MVQSSAGINTCFVSFAAQRICKYCAQLVIERRRAWKTRNGETMSSLLSPPNDGSGRKPREVQTEAYLDIKQRLVDHQVVSASLPPGYGKSFIARSLQREFGTCDIITSDNALFKQYLDTYPE